MIDDLYYLHAGYEGCFQADFQIVEDENLQRIKIQWTKWFLKLVAQSEQLEAFSFLMSADILEFSRGLDSTCSVKQPHTQSRGGNLPLLLVWCLPLVSRDFAVRCANVNAALRSTLQPR